MGSRITLYPVGRRSAHNPDPACTKGEAQGDGTHLYQRLCEARGRARSHVRPGERRRGRSAAGRAQHGAVGHDAGFQIAPERHHQFAGQGDQGDLADTALQGAHTLDEPPAQVAVGLVAEPQPCELDGERAASGVAGLADALLTIDAAAAPLARYGAIAKRAPRAAPLPPSQNPSTDVHTNPLDLLFLI